MAAALAAHDQIFREVTTKNSGAVFKTVGDAFCCAFARPLDALNASIDAQRRLSSYGWPTETGEVRVRMGIHTGTAIERDGDYFGPTLNRVARLMSIAHGGQIVLSAATASLLQSSTPRGVSFIDLGQHRLKDLSQPEHTFQVSGEGLRTDFPPLHSLDVVANNLPTQLTSFVGRERELHDLKALLADHRLITLIGPGGIGKTRLSLQLAAESIGDFKDGCWFAPLAGVEQPDLVPYVIATAIGISETPGQPIAETLVRDIGDKDMLLVIDNAEHLVAEVATLVRPLLVGCGHLAILITSREAVHVAGEQVVRISPLPVADREHLFFERARSVRSEFHVANSEMPAWTDLLQKLEGIPLAIELAAARLSTFTITQMDERLSSRLGLSSRDTTGAARQRTLRSTIDWSYQLLSDEEKRAFAYLSIFDGNFTLDACEAVLHAAGIENVEDVLQSLVEKSFVTTELEGAIPFYSLLELMREFSRERLEELGEVDPASRAHFNHYLTVATRGEKLDPKSRLDWLDAVDVEIGNVRSALAWSRTTDTRSAAEFGVSLSLYWQVRSHFAEGWSWLRQIVDDAETLPAIRMAPLLDRAAVFATMQGEYERARQLCNRACAAYEQTGDEVGLGKAIHALGVVEHRCGNLELARDSYARAIACLKDANVPRLLSTATANLAGVYIELDDLNRAEEGFAESLRLAESVGDLNLTSSILLNLANVEMRQHRVNRAESLLLRALEVKRKLRNAADTADALAMLAIVAAQQKQTSAARGHAAEALRISSDLKSSPLLIKALEAFVQIAVSEENYRPAARLLGLTEALRRNSGIRREAGISDAVPTIKAALSFEEFKALSEQGAATSPEDEVAALLASV